MRSIMATIMASTKPLLIGAIVLGIFSGCGKKKDKDDGGPAVGKVEAAFTRSSNESGVPSRLMLAVAWLESRISPEYATAFYLAPGEEEPRLAKGLRLTQSAFGMPVSTFGLDKEGADSSKLEVQADSYGKWVKKKLTDLKVDSHPGNSEDKVQWILRLAELHRDVPNNKRNLQALFAREIVSILNQGFIWQDPRNGEVLRFAKEEPAIKLSDLKAATRKQLEITTMTGDVPGTRYFQLNHTADPRGNEPKRIQVVHCPLSLSACLMLQDASDDEIRLGAHFAIPDTLAPDIFERALQIHDLHEVVQQTNGLGQVEEIRDSVVIMMTGNSGRYVNGVRMRANPNWLTESQLQLLGNVVNDACLTIFPDDEEGQKRCKNSEGSGSIDFRSQGASKVYQWGQIADYEGSIFSSYVREPGRKAGTTFEFMDQRQQFRAGEPVNFAVNFGNNAKFIVLQRLVRCPDERLTWNSELQFSLRSQSRYDFSNLVRLYDSGPNRNGEQFLRAMVYGNQRELLGWATDNVHITDFEKGGSGDSSSAVAPTSCD